jgi:site-specific recombinase XerD
MDRLDDLQAFEQHLRRRSPDRRTAIDYVSDVRQFAAGCSKPWREVTMHDIDSLVDQQRQAGLSPATVKRRVAALKVFFDFLAEESGELSWPNPVRCKRHAGKQPQRLPRDLSDVEVERVWAVISQPRDRAWFALMLRAGLRVGEVIALRLDDILAAPDGEQPARLRVLGKGRKERIVLLTADAYAVLAAWLQVRPPTAAPTVFLNVRGQPITVNGIEDRLRTYGQQVGLTLTPHQLRHTFARQTTEAGMPLTSLSKLLGHAQISTTEIYTAGADPALAQAYQAAMSRGAGTPAAPASVPLPPDPAVRDVMPVRVPPLPDFTTWAPELPTAIRQACLAYVQHCAPTWQPQRRRVRAREMLWRMRRFWVWQLDHRPLQDLGELTLTDVRTFQQAELARGLASTSINAILSVVRAVCHHQAEQGQSIDASLWRWQPLPRPDSLPRHLSPAEAQRLETHVRSRLTTPEPLLALENAWYYVLAHCGLRACECLELQYQDLDLPGRRLRVRQGKGQRDRIVYLSETATQALMHYRDGCRRLPAAPLFSMPTGRPLTYLWLCRHMAALAQAVAIPDLSPHRLRHTLATQLLNAGMDITSIQKLLGHEHVTTTQIYARVFDTTVEADDRQAMHRIAREQMPLSDEPVPVAHWPGLDKPGTPENATVPLARFDNSV